MIYYISYFLNFEIEFFFWIIFFIFLSLLCKIVNKMDNIFPRLNIVTELFARKLISCYCNFHDVCKNTAKIFVLRACKLAFLSNLS